MRLQINLATRRYVNTRGVKGVAVALCLLIGGALVYQVQDAAYRQGEIKRLKEVTAATAAKSGRGPQVSEPQYRELMVKIRSANEMLAQKSLDWVALLDQLEAVVPDGMALNSIEPSREGNEVKLTGVTRNFSAVRKLLENLEQSSYFSEVYLLSQQQAKVGLTQRGVTFSVTCKVGEL